MEEFGLLIIGILLSVIGTVNLTGNISTVHAYNRRKVREEDIPKYGKAMGLGTLSIGLSAVVGFFLQQANHPTIMAVVLAVGIVIGLALIFYAQFRYNKGFF